MQNDMMVEIINTLSELKRMHQLNMEILEQLAVTCEFLTSTQVKVPNSSTLASLLSKAMALLDELQSDEPKSLQYHAIRRKVTDGKSDTEVTEPSDISLISTKAASEVFWLLTRSHR